MANQEQLETLKQGVEVWNKWREEKPETKIDLSDIDLSRINLFHAELNGANFRKSHLELANFMCANLEGSIFTEAELIGAEFVQANLSNAIFTDANLSKADLSETNLSKTIFIGARLEGVSFSGANLQEAELCEAFISGASFINADLRKANLQGADLRGDDMRETDLRESNLVGVDLSNANLVGTKIDKAKISNSSVYGINVWDLKGKFEEQRDLVITPRDQPVITVDNIKVAQFIYLILNNEEVRDVINTLTSKAVLILGRFSIPERKAILDMLRNKLREYDLIPIVFDFDRPIDKDFTETIKTLVGMCYFVIADVTNPRSSPLELQATVPDYQIPFVPIIQEGESPFAMMVDLQKKYSWVLNTITYDSKETLLKVLKPLVIDPAMNKRQELRIIKAQEPEIISARDFLAKGKA